MVVSAARTGESETGMGVGLRGLQSQAAAPAGGAEIGRSGLKNPGRVGEKGKNAMWGDGIVTGWPG